MQTCFLIKSFGGGFLESEKSKIHEPKGRLMESRCLNDTQEYDNKKDYEMHYLEKHSGRM